MNNPDPNIPGVPPPPGRVTVWWVRADARLADQRALALACEASDALVPLVVHPTTDTMAEPWDFPRVGEHRLAVRAQAIAGLRADLQARASDLVERVAIDAVTAVAQVAQACGAQRIVTEEIAAPEEAADVVALRKLGFTVETVWQSSLLEISELPMSLSNLPTTFTPFRKRVEDSGIRPALPLARPSSLPLFPAAAQALCTTNNSPSAVTPPQDERSSFPYWLPEFRVDEAGAERHLQAYFSTDLPKRYKQTRNGLVGVDFSSKWSPWLAAGAMSARTIFARLQQYERDCGTNDGTYWLWFELLWRDYFRFVHARFGTRLYHVGGLRNMPPPPHNPEALTRWCNGRTSNAFVNAGMNELRATGFLSNRMRQVTASYLVHDLACDFRAGAAWFESQLVDYDVTSNYGNWLSIAGRGTNSLNERRFNPQLQAQNYDPDGSYRKLWAD